MEPLPALRFLCGGSLLLGESSGGRTHLYLDGVKPGREGLLRPGSNTGGMPWSAGYAVGRLRACRGRCRTSLAAELPVKDLIGLFNPGPALVEPSADEQWLGQSALSPCPAGFNGVFNFGDMLLGKDMVTYRQPGAVL